jgi:hypothetical protein
MLINVNNITQHCNYKKERMNFEERFYFRRNRRRKGRNRRRKGRKRGRGLEGFDIEYYFLVIPMYCREWIFQTSFFLFVILLLLQY